MTSYFFVRAKGTYKIFMMLGQRDTARVKIDNIEIFKSGTVYELKLLYI